MVCIRQATVDDLLQMQRCNLMCLPENYQLKVKPTARVAPNNCASVISATNLHNLLLGVAACSTTFTTFSRGPSCFTLRRITMAR